MTKSKILVALDGTERSMDSINWLKKFFSKEDTEVTLIHVIEILYNGKAESIAELSKLEINKGGSKRILDEASSRLKGYKVHKLSANGNIADRILQEAKEGSYDMMIMTKSSVRGISRVIGSVTNKVIHHSEVAVVVVPE
jgi:nucleotide-binding universal stress UspA family protein